MNYSDEEIIQAIIEGGNRLDAIMTHLYEHSSLKQTIEQMIIQKGGSEDDAKDVFQDGVKHLIINIRNAKFKRGSSLKTYLTRICLNIWFTKLKRSIHLKDITQQMEVEEVDQGGSPETIFLYEERTSVLEETLAQLGEACKKVLGFWSLNYSMKEIAQLVGYQSEGMARKKKHQCMQRLVLYIKKRPDLAKTLLEMYK